MDETRVIFRVTTGFSSTRVGVYDFLGRRVRALVSKRLQPGVHEACWDGRDDRGEPVAAGVYFVRQASGYGGPCSRPLVRDAAPHLGVVAALC